MAKIECELKGQFDIILNSLHSTIMGNSASATLEDSSDFWGSGSRCSVRAYERYTYLGKGRVSLNITLYEIEGRIFISAISTGGSQALFFKINTVGEHTFLNTIKDVIDSYRI